MTRQKTSIDTKREENLRKTETIKTVIIIRKHQPQPPVTCEVTCTCTS